MQIAVKTGVKNKTWNKTKLHYLTYRNIRNKYPMLNSSLVTAIRDQASDMIKHLGLKKKPIKRDYSGIRLNHNTLKVFSHYTSQACSVCGDIRRTNRKGRIFKCCVCGFTLHSDLNASRNIAFLAKGKISRLHVNQPIVACDDLKASIVSIY